jgi:hypothetical protein
MLAVRYSLCAVLCAVFSLALSGAESAPPAKPGANPEQVEADKKALAPILQFVGGWRGSGLPKDGNKDGWSEDSEWQYDLKGGHAALVFSAEKGKYYKAGRIEPGTAEKTFKFTGTLPDGKKEELTGAIEKNGDLVFKNAAPAEGRPARVVFSIVAKGNRLLMDFEKKMSGDRYSMIAEVGYTRKGSNFGKQGDMRECIITGGVGKIAVSYKGQTYYVCCGGCKEAFEENPEKELAAYHKRKEEEKLKDKQ